MKRRIVLSVFLGCAFCSALGCSGDMYAVADDQPLADVDAAVAGGIGTSPVWWRPWAPEPGPTDTTGAAP